MDTHNLHIWIVSAALFATWCVWDLIGRTLDRKVNTLTAKHDTNMIDVRGNLAKIEERLNQLEKPKKE